MIFLYNWLFNTLHYFESILPWLVVGIMISFVLKRYLTSEIIKKFLGKKSISAIIIAELIGAFSPVSIIALLPLSSFMLSEGASPATLIAFLLAARAYNPEALPVSLTLLGVSITILNMVIVFIGVTICSLSLNNKDFVIESSQTMEKSFFRQLLQLTGYIILGVIIAGFIVTAIPATAVAKYGGGSILSVGISIALGFVIYVYYIGYFPIAKSFLDVGLSHAAVITFLSSAGIVNLTFLLMFVPIIGKKNTLKIFLIYLVTVIISGCLLFFLHV